MDLGLPSLFGNIPHELLQVVAGSGFARAMTFLLVAARLTGFFLAWPLIERDMLPWQVRIGLVVLLTLIVAPGIEIAPDDSPSIMTVSHQEQVNAPHSTTTSSANSDGQSTDLAAGMICNAAIGASLALSLAVFLGGLKLAGEWIDRHSGLGMGQVLNPDFASSDSGAAKLVSLFSVAVMLTMLPTNGHLHLVRLILDTFRAIPIELTNRPTSLFDLIMAMMQQSSILGLRIAVPFVVAMSLLDFTLSWIRRSSKWDLASIAFVVRAAAAMLVLAATLPGIQEAVSASVHETLQLASSKIDSPPAQE